MRSSEKHCLDCGQILPAGTKARRCKACAAFRIKLLHSINCRKRAAKKREAAQKPKSPDKMTLAEVDREIARINELRRAEGKAPLSYGKWVLEFGSGRKVK